MANKTDVDIRQYWEAGASIEDCARNFMVSADHVEASLEVTAALANLHDLQRIAQAADDVWQAALVKRFGKRAGDVRYTAAAREGDLKPLHDAFQHATCNWRNHPGTSFTKGCTCDTQRDRKNKSRGGAEFACNPTDNVRI